jgi:POT family proton-dependent oligopeptide transporter
MLDPTPPAGGPATDAVAPQTGFFGHPRGLATLFFTEFWERFTYYGMRALLVLFMTADVARGGLGFSTGRAAAVYGLYTGSVWLAALPGGWIADRLLGQRRSVLAGGILIAAGNFLLVAPSQPVFFLGLVLIVMGTGMLKPNVSAIVGDLYPAGPGSDARRDAGFSIFYSGINLGAFLAPLVCSPLGEKVNWRLGFAAAGFGMLIGVFQYVAGSRSLGRAGQRAIGAADPAERAKALRLLTIGGAVLLGLVAAAALTRITPEVAAASASYVTVALAIFYFIFQIVAGGLDGAEKKRMSAIFALFVFAVVFWAGYEQAGSSLNLFSEKLTNRIVFGWEMPAGVLQSVNPGFVIVLAPVFAWIWYRLGPRNPSSPVKFSLGLVLLGLGFVVMVMASRASIGTATFGP